MNDSTERAATVAVIGGGLAAHTAARRLEEAGLRVILVRRGAGGMTALWGGLGFAFGPFTESPPDSAGAVEARQPCRAGFVAERAARWTRLIERRGTFHPYRRLNLDFASVGRELKKAHRLLDTDLLTLCPDGTRLPGPFGTPAAPDLAASSVAPLELAGRDRVGVFACPDLSGWRASELNRQLDRIDRLTAVVLRAPVFTELGGGHPAALGRELENRFTEDRSACLEQLREAVAEADIDCALFPPCLGADPASHARLVASLEDAVSVPVVEMPASRDSVHGWRLSRALQAMEGRYSRTLQTRAETLQENDDRGVRTIGCRDGAELEVDAVVIATGRWVDGGLSGSAPLVEPLTGVPIWLDGAPLPGFEEAYPPNFLERRPWGDHPLFRAGVSVDADGRPLDRNGRPRFQNVYAAGRILGGFNPAHDACSMGVDLVTARVVAERVVEQLEARSHTVPESS